MVASGFVIAALRFLLASAAPDDLLFPYSYAEYSATLLDAAQRSNTAHLGFSPHSPRAGKATQERLDGTAFETIREDGRWASATSLRIYLDRAKALAQATCLAGAQFSGIARTPFRIGSGRFFLTRPLPAPRGGLVDEPRLQEVLLLHAGPAHAGLDVREGEGLRDLPPVVVWHPETNKTNFPREKKTKKISGTGSKCVFPTSPAW